MRVSTFCVLAPLMLLACRSKDQSPAEGADGAPSANAQAPAPATVAPAIVPNDVPFAGTFQRTAKFTMKNGRRYNSGTDKGTSSITVGGGKVVYTLTYPGTDVAQANVVQTYSYGPGDVREVEGGYDVVLAFVKMDSNTKNFFPDSGNPRLQARRSGNGWQIGLTTMDKKGVFAGNEFR